MGYDSRTPFKLTTICNVPLYNGVELFFSPDDDFYVDDSGDFTIIWNGTGWYFQYQEVNIAEIPAAAPIPPTQPIPTRTQWIGIDVAVTSFSLAPYMPNLIITEATDPGAIGRYIAKETLESDGFLRWDQEGGTGYIYRANLPYEPFSAFYANSGVGPSYGNTGLNSADLLNFVPVTNNQQMSWSGGLVVVAEITKKVRYFENKQNLQESSPYVTVIVKEEER